MVKDIPGLEIVHTGARVGSRRTRVLGVEMKLPLEYAGRSRTYLVAELRMTLRQTDWSQ
jgi:hypothetical protein